MKVLKIAKCADEHVASCQVCRSSCAGGKVQYQAPDFPSLELSTPISNLLRRRVAMEMPSLWASRVY
jgi:hypothetical protein